jgi:hypothetical protein
MTRSRVASRRVKPLSLTPRRPCHSHTSPYNVLSLTTCDSPLSHVSVLLLCSISALTPRHPCKPACQAHSTSRYRQPHDSTWTQPPPITYNNCTFQLQHHTTTKNVQRQLLISTSTTTWATPTPSTLGYSTWSRPEPTSPITLLQRMLMSIECGSVTHTIVCLSLYPLYHGTDLHDYSSFFRVQHLSFTTLGPLHTHLLP